MFFNKLFQRGEAQISPARRSYEKIVAQARHPEFYLNGGVEDSVDGRFDMIVLHAVLVMSRLNEEADERAKAFSQAVFDEMFQDMDRSLREMGVGDLSVGKKIKKMAQVFYGRAKAYDDAMKTYSDRHSELEEAVQRNLLAESDDVGLAPNFAEYMMSCRGCLRAVSLEKMSAGEVSFADPEAVFGEST